MLTVSSVFTLLVIMVLRGKAAEAVRSATAASMASVVSVFLLMWLRTTMSYQHVKGVTLKDALQELYAQGGVARFYRGIIPALCMMPLSRFGDIFSNELSRELLSDSFRAGIVTMFASSLAACWRILITPADTMKTMMQVHGNEGLALLQSKIAKNGIIALYDGALGAR